ncbi:helix-turn-helix domain-containing protein [Streptomyces sp. NBC_01142]|uniref:helix-turn-helix domain-containing protein n=1 Tax=Streptomyces sp. NBC_01142 TaxID=2975865 RepID=UPI002250D884|nr:helix-turn-helix domain-containing protein [Streptomyces sp. NBC_01142]MCX4826222.1 helix-turn-helix domain-containing protein [Streptomyces sp. NBC_01142]
MLGRRGLLRLNSWRRTGLTAGGPLRYHRGHAVSTRGRADRRTPAVPRGVTAPGQAAERFAQGEASEVIARDLRVSARSIQRWRQMWNEGGPRALRSHGSTSLPRLRGPNRSC